jgi:hypothetical protein
MSAKWHDVFHPLNMRNYFPVTGSSLIVAAACVYFVLRVPSIWTPHMSGDEVFTYATTVDSWAQLAKLVAGDLVHPPLFYILFKLWGLCRRELDIQLTNISVRSINGIDCSVDCFGSRAPLSELRESPCTILNGCK